MGEWRSLTGRTFALRNRAKPNVPTDPMSSARLVTALEVFVGSQPERAMQQCASVVCQSCERSHRPKTWQCLWWAGDLRRCAKNRDVAVHLGVSAHEPWDYCRILRDDKGSSWIRRLK
jgi:hypothetical protein